MLYIYRLKNCVCTICTTSHICWINRFFFLINLNASSIFFYLLFIRRTPKDFIRVTSAVSGFSIILYLSVLYNILLYCIYIYIGTYYVYEGSPQHKRQRVIYIRAGFSSRGFHEHKYINAVFIPPRAFECWTIFADIFSLFFFYARFCFSSHSPARGRTIPQRIPFLPSPITPPPIHTTQSHSVSHTHTYAYTYYIYIYRDNMIYNIYGVRTACVYCVRYEFEINNAYGIRNIVL